MARRVCLITKDYPPDVPGGISRAVGMQARMLARAGVEVHVITKSASGEPNVRDDGGATVHEIPEPGLAVPADLYWFEIGAWSLAAAAKFSELDASVGFDVVEAPDYRGEALQVRTRPDTKLVVWLHSVMATAWKHNPTHVMSPADHAWHALEIQALRRADLLLAPSQLVLDATRDVAEAPLPDAELMPYLFDTVGFPARPERIPDGRNRNLLFFGRLEERKNPELALLTAAAARDAGMNVELILAGKDNGGYRRNVLDPLQVQLGVQPQYLDHVDAAGVRALLEQADAAILPSRFDNSPLVVLEALSTGVPVITGERVGIANWVEPENGLLALPVDDPASFAERAGQALADPEWIAAAGPRAAARVREIFDPEVVVPRLLDCYDRLLGSAPFKPATAPATPAPAAPTRIDGAKEHAVLAFADELSADDELLGVFCSTFGGEDPVTLVIYAPDSTEDEVAERLGPALARAGADEPGAADMLAIAVPASSDVERTIASGVHGVLTRRTLDEPYAQLRTFDGEGLRALLPRAQRRPAEISPELRAFVDECAPERQTILDFLIRTSDELQPGARVLDVGAGEQPYRELFPHVEYVTTDWANSVHPGARQVDIVAPADDLPVEDASFDAVINTQVLEHVPEPRKVIAEFFRVLKPGGRLYITLPLAWELHEEPWDFYRYTSHGIRHLLESAGFADVDPHARNDCFTTLAQLMRNTNHVMGRARDGLDPQRDVAADAMRQMADVVQGFAPLDVRHIFPLGYSTTATRPGA